MMKRFSSILVVVVLAGALLGVPPAARSQGACTVSAAYAEAANENVSTLLKLMVLSQSAPSPLDDPEVAAVYYTMLLSTRHYYEDARRALPDCAQDLNLAFIETITASQDVVALLLAQQLNPDSRRSQDRLRQAQTHLAEKWESLVRSSQATPLVSQD